ncbi:MAG: hypothetical protein AAF528_00770 [Cyanobacteria bacterium P01_C01_bin.121]
MFTSLENANAYVDFQLQSAVRCQLEDGNFLCDATYVNTRATAGHADMAEPPPTPQSLTAADLTSFVLVKAEKDGDVAALKAALADALPDQVQVLTQAEMAQQTRQYWLRRTGIGRALGLGAIASVGVSMVIIGQILSDGEGDMLRAATIARVEARSRLLGTLNTAVLKNLTQALDAAIWKICDLVGRNH